MIVCIWYSAYEKSVSSSEIYPLPTEAQLDALTEDDWEILDEITEGGFVSFAQAFQILRVVYPNLLTSMCYKGVRDEDSIEMLDIIFSVKTADIVFLWNISQAMQMTMAGNAVKGTEEVISVIQKENKSIQTTLDNYIEEYFTK